MVALCDTMPGDDMTDQLEAKLEERELSKGASLLAKRPASEDVSPTVKLGTGLLQIDDKVVAVKAGHLHFQAPNKFWIASHKKRYVPAVGDLVIGIVVAKMAELYRVDIGCHISAALPLSGFEGATRKNKPNLEVGSIVFARVLVANKDLEPELVCFDADNRSEGYGEVKPGGLLTRCSCSLSQALQRTGSPVLEALGKHFSFELIAGANGRFIINAGTVSETIAITSTIVQSEYLDPAHLRSLIKDALTAHSVEPKRAGV